MSADRAPDREDADKSRGPDAKQPDAEAKTATRPDEPPAAGPHAAPDLSNPEATPGAGALQAPGAPDDMDSTG
ncbi:MAG TPA: hypothetical protein VKV96_10355 [Roseiarcus sp.]|nr:hypothetical protein [Roseiarcus sp.]